MAKIFEKDLKWFLLRGLILICLSVAVYIPAMRGDFIWDDDIYIVKNPLLRMPDGLFKIWFSKEQPSQYFPMVYTTFLLEYKLWGLAPFGYHVTNIALHILNCFLLWWFFRKLNLSWGWVAAVIFAVHPIHVESVAWITERKNVLMMFFSMLAFLAWLGFLGNSKRGWLFYPLSLFFFAFALFSKTTACPLPIVLILIVWLRKIPITIRRLFQIVPFVLFSLAMGTVTMLWEYTRGAGGLALELNYLERFLLAARALWFYLGKIFWPMNLTFSYPKWNIDAAVPAQYIWPALWLIAAFCIWRLRKRIGRGAIVAIVFFVVTLLPMLGFFSLYTFYYTYVADHYVYLATAGPIALAAGAGSFLARRFGKGAKMAVAVVTVIVVAALSVLTFRQCHIYENLEALWRDTITKNPQSYMAYSNMAVLFASKGQIDESLDLFQKALEIEPDDGDVHYDYAITLKQKGRIDEAISHYRKAARLEPERRAEIYNSLGVALRQKRKLSEAIGYYRKALELTSRSPGIYYNLGNALAEYGKLDEAAECYNRAIELFPNYAGAYNNFGILLEKQNKFEQAIDLYRKAFETGIDDVIMRNNFVRLLVSKGKSDEAFQHFQSRTNNAAAAHLEFAITLLSIERPDLSLEQLRKAQQLEPDWPIVLIWLARVLIGYPGSQFHNPSEAIELAEQASVLTRHQDANVLIALSQTYASAGRLDKAIKAARDALMIATKNGNEDLAEDIRSRLRLYMAHKSPAK